ncbi:hypothetical protein AHAS_Ahas13G0277200 [Arachis hypogaea]
MVYLFAFVRYTTKDGAMKDIAEMNHWRLRGKVINVGEAKFRRLSQKRVEPRQMILSSQHDGEPGDSHHGKGGATDRVVVEQPMQDQKAPVMGG